MFQKLIIQNNLTRNKYFAEIYSIQNIYLCQCMFTEISKDFICLNNHFTLIKGRTEARRQTHVLSNENMCNRSIICFRKKLLVSQFQLYIITTLLKYSKIKQSIYFFCTMT